eukprot:scaffold8882_cov51-Attheya_sp.AAC.1
MNIFSWGGPLGPRGALTPRVVEVGAVICCIRCEYVVTRRSKKIYCRLIASNGLAVFSVVKVCPLPGSTGGATGL